MKKIIIKIGDVFSAPIDQNSKKYFQYIADDLTQLNSNVIRGFKKKYLLKETPVLSEVTKDEVDFYAHCFLRNGIKMHLWEKLGNATDIGELNFFFRDTNDYGIGKNQEPIKISNNWYVWKVNDKSFTRVGKLEGGYKNAFIGLVFNPLGILEMLKGNKYPPHYPEYSND